MQHIGVIKDRGRKFKVSTSVMERWKEKIEELMRAE